MSDTNAKVVELFTAARRNAAAERLRERRLEALRLGVAEADSRKIAPPIDLAARRAARNAKDANSSQSGDPLGAAASVFDRIRRRHKATITERK